MQLFSKISALMIIGLLAFSRAGKSIEANDGAHEVLSEVPVITTGWKHPARTPSFVTFGPDLWLFWHYGQNEVVHENATEINISAAQWREGKFVPAAKMLLSGWSGFDVPVPETLHFCASNEGSQLMSCMAIGSERRQALNANIYLADLKNVGAAPATTETNPTVSKEQLKLFSSLPDSSDDLKQQATAKNKNSFFAPMPPHFKDNYLRPSLFFSPDTKVFYLTGIEENDAMWLIESHDNGKTWDSRRMLMRGNFPQIIFDRKKELLLFYTDPGDGGTDGVWPDDDPVAKIAHYDWPGVGPLLMRRSKDEGKTWSDPITITGANAEFKPGAELNLVAPGNVVQSRAALAPDGMIWVVYVRSDFEKDLDGRTSLWLVSSDDDGATWTNPIAVTDGKYLDR